MLLGKDDRQGYRSGSTPPVRDLYGRLKERGAITRRWLRSPVCSGHPAIAYGCWSRNERYDPVHEERLKACQTEKKAADDGSTEEYERQGSDLSAPVSRKEA